MEILITSKDFQDNHKSFIHFILYYFPKFLALIILLQILLVSTLLFYYYFPLRRTKTNPL